MTGSGEDELATFRAEVAAWIEAHCPASMRRPVQPGEVAVWGGRRQEYPDPAARKWLEAMAAQGWTAPTWPVDCGGAGLDRAHASVLAEELRRAGARPPIVRLSQAIGMLGPCLLEHGTPEQQRRFLPPIARGELRFCQGFSEPEAGSDLAGVRTRGELQGSAYVVNGHKIWSSYAHQSDWIFCLVRTEPDAPKHEGISFLLIDLDSPGVTVSPITLISGKSDFCEVFFADVEVPVDQLVGSPGQGWSIAKQLLVHERSLLGGAGGALAGGGSKRKTVVDLARSVSGVADVEPLPDGALRERIAAHLMEVRALKALTQRMTDEGRRDAALPSMMKLVSTETFMRRQDLTVDVLGAAGLAWDGDGPAGEGEAAAVARDWLRSRANSIEGGTSEIQLNIIAKRALGLPEAAR